MTVKKNALLGRPLASQSTHSAHSALSFMQHPKLFVASSAIYRCGVLMNVVSH